MNADTLTAIAKVIQSCPSHHAEVLGCRHEVQWPDGTAIGLHPVLQHGIPAKLLRALHHNGQWYLLDLEHIIPRDIGDLKAAPSRDQVGLVMYAMRRVFHNAAALLAKVDRQHLAKWPGDPRPAVDRPKAVKALMVGGVDVQRGQVVTRFARLGAEA